MMRRGVYVAVLLAVVALLFLAWHLGDTPEAPPPPPATEAHAAPVTTETPPAATVPTTTPSTAAALEPTAVPSAEPSTKPSTVAATTAPAAEPSTAPATSVAADDGTMTCTLTIRCDTLLSRLDELAEEKRGLVPESGVLLDVTATFVEGESLMNILSRETRRARLHMEFIDTPGLRSAYVKGIGNLYEHDCGPLSGWTYRVNEVFPGYGCSLYMPQDGDAIVFAYTCDLGVDIGGYNEIIEE